MEDKVIINEKEYSMLAKKFYERLKSVFDEDVGSIKITIENDEDKFAKKAGLGPDAPKFLVGFAKELDEVVLLNKDKYISRGLKTEEFEQVMLHEMTHIFFRRNTQRPVYPWIEEGFCEYISFPEDNNKPIKFIDLIQIKTAKMWRSTNPYVQSKKFISFIVDKYGMKKFVSFIRLLKDKEEEKAFFEAFGKRMEDIQEDFKNEKIIPSSNAM